MFNPSESEIKELREMVKQMKEMIEHPEMQKLANEVSELYLGTLLKNKALEAFTDRYIDKLATAIVKAVKNG